VHESAKENEKTLRTESIHNTPRGVTIQRTQLDHNALTTWQSSKQHNTSLLLLTVFSVFV